MEQLGAIHLVDQYGKLQRTGQNLPIAEQLQGEALSGVISPEFNLYVVTHPTPGLVTCWTLSSMKLHKVIKLKRARDVALSDDSTGVYCF